MVASNELRKYLDSVDRITHFSGKKQKKKVMLMLQYLASIIEFYRNYSEREVNDLHNQFHTFKDLAIIRRLLFVRRYLSRTKGGRSYWKE